MASIGLKLMPRSFSISGSSVSRAGVFGHRADEFIGYRPVAFDDEGFGHAIDAEIDPRHCRSGRRRSGRKGRLPCRGSWSCWPVRPYRRSRRGGRLPPRAEESLASSSRIGCSWWQGTHQEAKTFTKVTWPCRRSASLRPGRPILRPERDRNAAPGCRSAPKAGAKRRRHKGETGRESRRRQKSRKAERPAPCGVRVAPGSLRLGLLDIRLLCFRFWIFYRAHARLRSDRHRRRRAW